MDRFELRARQLGYTSIAGVDEAGRGPLAGPVVAAAVILPPGYRNEQIRDSKKLTPLRRTALYETIHDDALAVGVGVVGPSVIDSINILRAALKAMETAVYNLSAVPDYILIDGINGIEVPCPQETIIKGDALSVSIAAASIIAKVTRDRLMDKYHDHYPHYNFRKNKGYGTKEHREAIREFGRCAIHRNSFRLKSE